MLGSVDLWAVRWHRQNFVPETIELDFCQFGSFPSYLNINDDIDRLCEGKEGSEPGDDVADDVADHAKVRTVSALGVVEHPENRDCFEC